jgi:hypothetical protein
VWGIDAALGGEKRGSVTDELDSRSRLGRVGTRWDGELTTSGVVVWLVRPSYGSSWSNLFYPSEVGEVGQRRSEDFGSDHVTAQLETGFTQYNKLLCTVYVVGDNKPRALWKGKTLMRS